MVIKKIMFTILIAVFISAAFGNSQAEPVNKSEADRAVYEAEKTASEFLCARMQALVSHNIDVIDGYFSDHQADSQKYLMIIKQNLLQDYTIAYASGDYVIVKVIPRVKIIRTAGNETSAVIEALLSTDILWNSANSASSPIRGQKSERHRIKLIKENQQWKIIQDIFQTKRGSSEISTRENIDEMRDQLSRLKEEAMKSLAKAGRSKPTRLTPMKPQPSPSHPGVPTQPQSRLDSRYDRKSVYNWAYMHWNNYSASFMNFGDEKWKGGDCTNFVSQCLRAGGAVNDKSGAYQWYYDSKNTGNTSDDSYSWTWTTARGLNNTLLGNYKTGEFGPKATEKVIAGDIQYTASIGEFVIPGDIIQYHWKTKSTISHAAVIVDMLYNSAKERYEPVIAEHTEDSWYTPWTNNALKTYFVHITGVN